MLAPVSASLFALTALHVPPALGADVVRAPAPTVTVQADAMLDEVLRQLVSLGDQSVTYERSTSEALQATSCGLLADVSVPEDRLQPLVEGLLALQGFALTAVRVEAPRVLVVHRAGDARIDPPVFQVESWDQLEDSAALRVSITQSFPHLEEHTLAAMLRPLSRKGILEITAEEDRAVFVGSGVQVADLIAVLRSLNPDHPGDEFPSPSDFFTEASGPLVIEGSPSLLDVLVDYSRITDVNPSLTAKARESLAETRIASAGDVVARDQVHEFVSELLHVHGFSTAILCFSEPRLLGVFSRERSRMLRRLPVRLESPEELSRFASLEIIMPLALQTLDARQLPTTLRPLLADAGPSTSLFSSGRDRLVLGGRAADLRECWSFIAEADGEAR